MIPPNSHNPEERRFVQEIESRVTTLVYLRGIGIKGLRPHHLASIPSRVFERRASARGVRCRSLFILPTRNGLGRRFNTRWLSRQLLRLTAGRPGDWTLWTRFPSPELVDALASVRFGCVIYEPIDSYSAAEDLSAPERQRIADAEDRLARFATVVAGGLGLAERFRTARAGSHWLPFGHDLSDCRSGPGVDASIPKPRLCVVGEFDWRMDEELLCGLARRHPEWQLVLAGPRRRPWGAGLKGLPNVFWLGRIPSQRVPSVIAECDVTLVPYRLTDWTRMCLPVKVFEYLAEGKPVVATPLPELSLFADVVETAPAEGFDHAIAQALKSDSAAAAHERRNAAKRYTIQSRARHAVRLAYAPVGLPAAG
jgi:glycosyltransferase involved in cell wall biosynthesis